MTVVQLFHRIGRRARSVNGIGGDFTKLSMTEQTDLAEAANTALQTLYGLLPTAYKEKTQGFLLPGPLTVSIAVVSQSADVPDSTFTAAQLGRTVVLDGDSNWNQVIATNRLLNPYMGPTTGTVSGTVYGDAFYSTEYPFERIVGNPTIPAQGSVMPINRVLVPMTSVGGLTWLSMQTTGYPQFWGVQPLGYSQGEEPVLVMRVMPAPNAAMAIDVRTSYWPKRLTLSDYDAASRVPVADQFLETALIPLALYALTSTPIFDGRGEDALAARAQQAEDFLTAQPGQLGAPANRCFTPVGF